MARAGCCKHVARAPTLRNSSMKAPTTQENNRMMTMGLRTIGLTLDFDLWIPAQNVESKSARQTDCRVACDGSAIRFERREAYTSKSAC